MYSAHQVEITEDDVIREANREKVLEMYGTSKIEAIPLSHQTEKNEEEPPAQEPQSVAEFTSGRLFAPPAAKRALRHPNPPVRTFNWNHTKFYDILLWHPMMDFHN